MMGRAREAGDVGDSDLDARLQQEEFERRLRELKELVEAEIRRRLVADRGVEAMARTLRKPLPEDVDFMHASARRDARAAARDLPADAGARGTARAAPAPPTSRHARLPQDGACVALVRRCSGGAEVQEPARVEARDHGRGRHLGLGRELRTLHPAVRVRDGEPVLEGPVVGVHRRHRRGHQVLPGMRRRDGRRPSRQHRGRRRLGRRALRLRPRVRGVPRPSLQRGVAEVVGDPARRRAEQLPRVAGLGRRCAAEAGQARVLAEPGASAATGTPAIRSSPTTCPTATVSTSAATFDSSSASSPPSPRVEQPGRAERRGPYDPSVQCAACGHENRDGARFCEECGARIGAAADSPELPATLGGVGTA